MDTNLSLSLLLDPGKPNCVNKTLAPTFLSVLKDHTYSKSDAELGEKLGLSSPGSTMSQIKTGRLYLKIVSLHNIAAEIGITYGKLAAIICKKMLFVSDPDKRRPLLAALQATTQLTDGRFFREKIGGIRKEEQFLKDGIVPSKWIELIDDPRERVRIISTHCGKPIVPRRYQKNNGKPKNGKGFSDGKKAAEGSAAPHPGDILAPIVAQDDLPIQTETGKIIAEEEPGFIGPLPRDLSALEETVPDMHVGPMVFLQEEDAGQKPAPESFQAEAGGSQIIALETSGRTAVTGPAISSPEVVPAPQGNAIEEETVSQPQPDGNIEPDGTADHATVQEEGTSQIDPDWQEKLETLASIGAKPPETPVPQKQPQEMPDPHEDRLCTEDKFFYEISRAIFAAGRASIMQNEEDVFIGRLTKELLLSKHIVTTNRSGPDGKIIFFTIMDEKNEDYFTRKFDISKFLQSN